MLFEKKALATLFVKEFIDRIIFFCFHVRPKVMAGTFFLLKKQNSLEIMSGKKEMTPNRVVNWPFRTL